VSRTRYFVLCALVLTGAFAGGFVADRAVPVAHAQILPAMEQRATAFTLVSPQGQVLATLHSGNSGAELTLNDSAGKSRVEISPSGGILIRDQYGRETWRSPN
jgi:hypothetical protein